VEQAKRIQTRPQHVDGIVDLGAPPNLPDRAILCRPKYLNDTVADEAILRVERRRSAEEALPTTSGMNHRATHWPGTRDAEILDGDEEALRRSLVVSHHGSFALESSCATGTTTTSVDGDQRTTSPAPA
jgi:hypothetical protein